jgi:hypothetical protein
MCESFMPLQIFYLLSEFPMSLVSGAWLLEMLVVPCVQSEMKKHSLSRSFFCCRVTVILHKNALEKYGRTCCCFDFNKKGCRISGILLNFVPSLVHHNVGLLYFVNNGLNGYFNARSHGKSCH